MQPPPPEDPDDDHSIATAAFLSSQQRPLPRTKIDTRQLRQGCDSRSHVCVKSTSPLPKPSRFSRLYPFDQLWRPGNLGLPKSDVGVAKLPIRS